MNQRFAALIAALSLSLPAVSAWADGAALAQLQNQAGDAAVTAPPPVVTRRGILPPPPEQMPDYDSDDAPVRDGQPVSYARPMIACTMSLRYRETSDSLLFLRVGKHIDGTAVIVCPDRRIPLRIHGDGFAPGLIIPNRTPFQSVNGVVAGNIEVRLPTVFLPKQLEGTYHSIGGDILGAGGSFSPWINSDASLDFTFYLPTTLNLSVGFDISTLELRLM